MNEDVSDDQVKAQWGELTSTKGCFSLAKQLKKQNYHEVIQFVPELKDSKAAHVKTLEVDYLTDDAVEFLCNEMAGKKAPAGVLTTSRRGGGGGRG